MTLNFLQNSDSEADTAGLEQENVCSIVLLGTTQALVASMGWARGVVAWVVVCAGLGLAILSLKVTLGFFGLFVSFGSRICPNCACMQLFLFF